MTADPPALQDFLAALPSGLRLGLVRNPSSQRNRLRRARLITPERDGAPILEIEPGSKDEIAEVVAQMSRRGIDHLIVDGGDGTLRDVMSALPDAYGSRLPTLSLLSGGNANLAANDVGTPGHGPEALARLLASLHRPGAGSRVRRRPVELRWPDGSHAPVLAFFVGAAVFHRGWKLSRGTVHRRGLLHGPAVAATLASAIWKTLAGGERSDWRAGTDMSLAIDGAAAGEGRRFLFLATGLHRLYGKLWPFFDHGEQALRWLDVAAPPPRLARALPSLLRGQPRPWMRDSGAYRSGGASRIDLRLEAPLVVDGEVFSPGAYGMVELQAGPELEFYTPEP